MQFEHQIGFHSTSINRNHWKYRMNNQVILYLFFFCRCFLYCRCQGNNRKQKHCIIIFSVPFLYQCFIPHFTFPRCLLNYSKSNGASRAPYKFLFDFIFIIFVVPFSPFFDYFCAIFSPHCPIWLCLLYHRHTSNVQV